MNNAKKMEDCSRYPESFSLLFPRPPSYYCALCTVALSFFFLLLSLRTKEDMFNFHKQTFFLNLCNGSSGHVTSFFRLVQAGLVNVSIVYFSRGNCLYASVMFIIPWFTSTVFVCDFHHSMTSLFVFVHVCSALGAFSGSHCEREEPTHVSRGCQGTVGQNL